MKRKLIIAGLSAIMLLTVGACKSHHASTALTIAAERGDAAEVKKLIAAGVNLNERDEAGYTALTWAARNGSTGVAKALIEAKADINARDCAVNGWTPLIHAIHKNNNEMARLLIDRGADVNAMAGSCTQEKIENGATALVYAAGNDNAEIVKALLAKGANPYGVHGSESVLSHAVASAMSTGRPDDKQCPTETVKVLLESAPDLNLQGDVWDRATVFFARQKGCTELVGLLEKRGSMLSNNQQGSRLGTHYVKVTPACSSTSSSSEGGTDRFSCGDTTVLIEQERLTVNGQSYGVLKEGDSVEVNYGKVSVKSKQGDAVPVAVASN